MKKLLLPAITYLLLTGCVKEKKEDAVQATADSLATKQHDLNKPTKTTAIPHNKISNPKFAPELLYGIWTLDNDGPHADFELTKKSFFVVDYDGDGDMPYTISHDTLTVKYKDYTTVGIIKKAVKDTMVINWDNGSDVIYFIWKG